MAVYAKFLAFFTLVWICLSQGTMHSWILGIVVVPAATWLSVDVLCRDLISHTPSIRLTGFARFLPFFLWQSLRGGWDSAQFALLPGKNLRLGFLKYSTCLPAGRPRLYFLHVVSLLPGTVSAAIEGDEILIHALDASADHVADLRECEAIVAALFGLERGGGVGGEVMSVEERAI